MSDDRTVSKLLSKSFHGQLTNEEQAEVNHHLADNQSSGAFARLSRMIQDSVIEVARGTQAGQLNLDDRLSDEAKSRMLDSIRKTKAESMVQIDPSLPPAETLEGDRRVTTSRFTLLRKIGQGGLGAVWLARDELLKRTVAMKELSSDKHDSPKHLQRFQREAMITGLLEHPNVVPLYMFGVNAETGKPFYAMRFLGKQTLHDAIEVYHARRRSGQVESIDLHRLLTVFLDICQAIAYAHSRGVVHRDLKPENVALDNFGQVIVLDWGIAKLLTDGEIAIQASLSTTDSVDTILTHTVDGEVIGTPLFMAPEQAAGDHAKVDERTDVFGLGAILYAILTGKAPHHESTVQAAPQIGLSDMLKTIVDADIPNPADANPQVPRDLAAICMRSLCPHRYARHGSAKELADDVERWMAGQHEKTQRYEALRLEGNNIRLGMEACIRDFATNARFVATLPPIAGLMDSAYGVDDDGEVVWRERLTTIFRGLLRSNPDLQAIAFSQVKDEMVHELVRVEKLDAESQARAVPKSRLVVAPLRDFDRLVVRHKPDDVRVASVRFAENDECTPNLLLLAGIPIFDREEELFGLVTLEGDFHRLIDKRTESRDRVACRTLVVDEEDQILVDNRCSDDSETNIADLLANWAEIKQTLVRKQDYRDRTYELYATRIRLCPRAVRSLKVVLMLD